MNTFVSFPVVEEACAQVVQKNDTEGSCLGADSLRSDCMFSMAGNEWNEHQELSFHLQSASILMEFLHAYMQVCCKPLKRGQSCVQTIVSLPFEKKRC